MKLGFTSMNTPDDIAAGDLARALEDRGYTSMWVGEHSHIPVSRKTPYPAGGEMPGQYRQMMDPFISLAVAAHATTRLRIGTGVALPLEHDVFTLAKQVATLDRLSEGRLDFGVGVGWNEEEFADHRPTIPWKARYRALGDCIGALKALWGQEEAEYHGEFFDFAPVWSAPKPAQAPHPPLVCGTSGRLGALHAAAWADDWMPMDVGLGNVSRRIEQFRQVCAEAGRAPLPITMVVWGDPTPETLHHYRELGVSRCVLGAARRDWHDRASTMPFIDRYAALVSELD